MFSTDFPLDAIEDGTDLYRLKTEDGVEIRRLHIKLLDRSINCDEIKFLLSVFGTIVEIQIFGKNIKSGWKMRNRGFVTFEKASEASSALINRKQFSDLFELAPGDTWNQPGQEHDVTAGEEIFCDQSGSQLFQMLNDDCLLHVIKFLDVLDVLSLEKVCTKFSELAGIHLKSVKALNFDDIKFKKKLTLHEARMVLSATGQNVNNASVSSEKFHNQRILTLIPKYLTNLRYLRLTGFKLQPKDFWDRIGNLLLQLEVLDLSDNSEIDENFMKAFKKSDAKLKLLDVSNCTVNGNFLSVLPNVESLNISGCRFITGKQLTKFMERNTHLTSLNISKCPNIFGKEVNDLLQKALQLQVLSLNNYYIDEETSRFVIPSINPLTHLKQLMIQNINYPPCDQLLRTINLENRIEVLNICYGYLTLTSVYAIRTMKSLKKLVMNFKNSVPDDFVDYLMELERLEELHVSGCTHISPFNALRLFRLPKFRFLDISRCYGYTNEFILDVVDELIENQASRDIVIHVGLTEIDQQILKDEKLRKFRHKISLKWHATKDVEHDYDIDEENKYEMHKPDNSTHQECFSIDGNMTQKCSEQLLNKFYSQISSTFLATSTNVTQNLLRPSSKTCKWTTQQETMEFCLNFMLNSFYS